MSGPAMFVDTNVLIYAEDNDEPDKRLLAMAALGAMRVHAEPCVNTQVLGEYYTTLMRKFPNNWDAENAWEAVDSVTEAMHILPVNLRIVREAIWGARRYQMHYYDAQLWATAKLAGVRVILTEDIPSAPEIEGVRYVDPFGPDFDIDALIAEVSEGD